MGTILSGYQYLQPKFCLCKIIFVVQAGDLKAESILLKKSRNEEEQPMLER